MLNRTAISLITGLPKDPSQVIAGMLGPASHVMVANIFNYTVIRTNELVDDLLAIDRMELYNVASLNLLHIDHARILQHDAIHAWMHTRDQRNIKTMPLMRLRILEYEFQRGGLELDVIKKHAAHTANEEIYNLIGGEVRWGALQVEKVSINIPISDYHLDAVFTRLLIEPHLAHTISVDRFTRLYIRVQLPLHIWLIFYARAPEFPTWGYESNVKRQSAEVARWLLDTFPTYHGMLSCRRINKLDRYLLLLEYNIKVETENVECALAGFQRGFVKPKDLISAAMSKKSEYLLTRDNITRAIIPHITPEYIKGGTPTFKRLVAKIYRHAEFTDVMCPELITLARGDHTRLIMSAISADSPIALRNILICHTGPLVHVCTLAIREKAIRCMRALRDEIRKHRLLCQMASACMYI